MRGSLILLSLGCLMAVQALDLQKTSGCNPLAVRSGLPDPGFTSSDGIRENQPPIYTLLRSPEGKAFGTEEYERNVINVMSARSTYRSSGLNRRDIQNQPFSDRMTTFELITLHGYPNEVHKIQTDDGYVLQLHRIPSNGIPVLLVHGIADSSATWVLSGKDKGLAFILSDLGYDVWLLNTRGNTYSRNHISLNPNRKSFWQYSFHEIGYYDLPATIDFISRKTDSKKMHYIGHSQGSTAFFVLASMLPQYSRKILSAHAFAPVAYLSNIKSPMAKLASKYYSMIMMAAEAMDLNELVPYTVKMAKEGQAMCSADSYYKETCHSAIFFTAGPSDHLNATLLPTIIDHVPAGTSRQSCLHYLQVAQSGAFAQYDYGPTRNIVKYGSPTPPKYDLGRIRVPVALYYARNDWIADPFDVQRLKGELKEVIAFYEVPDPKFNHVDFLWGIEAKKLVYDKLIEMMSSVEATQN